MRNPRVQEMMKSPQVQGLIRQAAPMMNGDRAPSSRKSASVDNSSGDGLNSRRTVHIAGNFNIRSGPGTQYRTHGTVADFEGKIKTTGRRSGKWVEVKYGNGKRGWVTAKAISKTSKPNIASRTEARIAKANLESSDSEPPSRANTEELSKPEELSREHVALASPPAPPPFDEEPPFKQVQQVEQATAIEPPKEKIKQPVAESKIIDKSKPQCAESADELEANSTLKAKLSGYTPFQSWSGANSDILMDKKTGKMQVVIHSSMAFFAKMAGYARVNPLEVKVCLDSEDASPYVQIGTTKYDSFPTNVTLGEGGRSETYKMKVTR